MKIQAQFLQEIPFAATQQQAGFFISTGAIFLTHGRRGGIGAADYDLAGL